MSFDPRSSQRPDPSSRPPGGQPGRAAPGLPPRGPQPPEQPSSTFISQHPILRVALFAAGILLLALCAALTVSVGAVLLPGLRATSQPTATTGADATSVLSQFCDDVQRQRYPQAYALFSAQLQGHLSQTLFVQRAQQLDSSKGTVSQCAPAQGGETSTSPTSATFDMEVSRTLQGTTSTYSGEISVVKTSSAWSIDAIDSALGLT